MEILNKYSVSGIPLSKMPSIANKITITRKTLQDTAEIKDNSNNIDNIGTITNNLKNISTNISKVVNKDIKRQFRYIDLLDKQIKTLL